MINKIKFSRFEIPYKVYGNSGSHIICVNGAQQTMAVWRSFISYFSKKYKVIVFDFPGQGRAKINHGNQSISFDEQIDVLHEIVKTLSCESKVNLFGSSWGGIVVARFASCYPNLVNRAILASFGIKPSEKMTQVILEGQKLYHNSQGKKIGKLILESFGQQIPDVLKNKIIYQFETMSEEYFMAFLAHSKFVNSIRHVSDIVDLNKIRAKILIINGENDTLLDSNDIRSASLLIPDCKYKIVKTAGHFLHFERADILQVYDEFFSK